MPGIDLEQLAVVGQVALAMLLGCAIGLEREAADKPAGVRTHMLVAGMAALLVGLGQSLIDLYDLETSNQILRADPIRIVEAVITGISFLGAGTIIRRRGAGIEGLTTAASILLTAGVGIAVAVGRVQTALAVTVLALVVLYVIGRIEAKMGKGSRREEDRASSA